MFFTQLFCQIRKKTYLCRVKRKFENITHSSAYKRLHRQSLLGSMLFFAPLMILIVLEFWMDIWCIGYEFSCHEKLFKDMCLRAAPQIEEYRLANGQPPKSLVQFGFDESCLGLEYFDTTNHNHKDVVFWYLTYSDGTFVLEHRGYGNARFISQMDTSWFLYYDDETEERVVEMVRPKHEFIRFKKK